MVRSLRTPGHRALMQVLMEARKESKFTQQELASRLSRPQSFITKVETGERRLDIVEFIEWADALNLPPSNLIARVRESERCIQDD